MPAPLQYLLITVKVVALEKEKIYLLTKENLTQTIQIQLSQKQKTFFEFFFPFLKCILTFKHLLKKRDPHS